MGRKDHNKNETNFLSATKRYGLALSEERNITGTKELRFLMKSDPEKLWLLRELPPPRSEMLGYSHITSTGCITLEKLHRWFKRAYFPYRTTSKGLSWHSKWARNRCCHHYRPRRITIGRNRWTWHSCSRYPLTGRLTSSILLQDIWKVRDLIPPQRKKPTLSSKFRENGDNLLSMHFRFATDHK